MGSVGLSFGSPTSGQGFDVTSTVNQIVANLQNAESPFKTQLSNLQSQDTAISNLGNLLSALSKDMQSLTDAAGTLASKLGSSSDTNTLALTSADSTAVAGSHTVTVTQLAQTASVYSQAIGTNDTLSGSISIQVGSGAAQTIQVDPAQATLAGLAATINQAGVGVTASVITDSSGSRLSLVSQTSGAAGTISINSTQLLDSSSGSSPAFTVAQSGQDAQIVVDGVPVSSASNSVSGVISGVSFQLLNTTAAPLQIQITNDTSSATQSVTKLVKDYNAVVSAMNAQESKSQPLYGNPLLASIQQQLSGALNTSGSGSIKSIADLGLSIANDGTLTLNTDQLASALNAHFSGVQSFFQSNGSFGFTLQQAAEASGSDSPLGSLAQAEKANSSMESSLNDTISKLDGNIAQQKTQLTAELNAANQTLQFIPMQVNEINEIYSAISGYSSTKG